jgi:hypothetical protein
MRNISGQLAHKTKKQYEEMTHGGEKQPLSFFNDLFSLDKDCLRLSETKIYFFFTINKIYPKIMDHQSFIAMVQ